MSLLYVVFGILFGFVLSRSGAADYNFIQSMFLFTSFQLYGIIGTAIAVTIPGLLLLKKFGRTIGGARIAIDMKPLNRGNAGPIFVNIGEGKLYAIAALAGALAGAALLGAVYPKLERPLHLASAKSSHSIGVKAF